MLLSVFLLISIICLFILLVINTNNMNKNYKSNKFKLYVFLFNIFETNKINYKDKFYKYALNTQLIIKKNNNIYLSSDGLNYIKDFNVANSSLFYNILALILSILSFIINLRK